MAKSQILKVVLFGLLGIGLITGAVFLGHATGEPQPLPLTGLMAHDFGSILLREQEIRTLKHTFELRNTSRRPVEITRVWSTCGCTVATPDRTRIEPGGTVRIVARLDLAGSGRRVESVFVELGRDGVLELRVAGAARRETELRAIPSRLALAQGRQSLLTLHYHNFESDGAPTPPVIEAPSGLEVHVSEWSLVRRSDIGLAQPARWQCAIEVSPTATVSEGSITIRAANGVVEIPFSAPNTTP